MNQHVWAYFAVGLGGGLGAVSRMALSRLVDSRCETFPLGTLIVNVSGCLLMGILHALSQPEGRLVIDPVWRQFLFIGILGGYTTFSSFSVQTLSLAQDGEWIYAALNILLSFVLCLVGVWLGSLSGQAINNWR